MRILSISFLILLTACGESENENRSSVGEPPMPPVVEVNAADYAFQAPDTIQSGWTTLRLINEKGMEIHELGLAKLPAGRNLADYMNDIMPPWEQVLVQLQDGEIEASEIGEMAYEMLPDWNSEIQYIKSRGLISPGKRTENIMYLEPGTYMIECWVKSSDGKIHISNGMIRQLTVLEKDNGASAPEAGYSITLSEDGIEAEVPLRSGKQIVGVDFERNAEDQLYYGNLHVIRADDETDFESVNEWMGWYSIGGLRAPAPAEFLGGMDTYGTLPYGGKAYFTVDLQPGNYAWIVHSTTDELVWKRFIIE